MRITIVQGAFLPVPPLMGGAVEKVWYALGKEFVNRGNEVVHISRNYGDLPREITDDGVRHIRVNGFSAPRSPVLLKLYDLVYSLRVLRRLPPADIVVTNTFWLPILAQNRQTKSGRLFVHVSRAPKGQMRFYQKSAVLNTVSQPIAEAIISECPSVANRVSVIAYPLPYAELPGDKDPAGNSADSGLVAKLSAATTILYVGRVHPEKGIELLLEAFAIMSGKSRPQSQYRLKIVGPHEADQGGGGLAYLEALRKKAKLLGIEARLDWVGPLYNDVQLGNIYRSADVFVYPSLAEKGETFGLAPLEAMAFGCPPIVSALACFEAFVENEVNGLIFNHRASDPAAELAASMKAHLENPKLDQVRANGLNTARRFTVGKIAERHLSDFQSILSAESGTQVPLIARDGAV